MGKDVIIACDFNSAEETFAFLDKFTGKKPFVKMLKCIFWKPENSRMSSCHSVFLMN